MAFPPEYFEPLDLRSFKLGMIYAFTEAVASGCKPLAFSPPLEPAEYPGLLTLAEQLAQEYEVLAEGDEECIESLLFNPEFTRGKKIILIAESAAVLRAYKDLKARALAAAQLPEVQRQREQIAIATALGELLGYSSEVIAGLLEKPRF